MNKTCAALVVLIKSISFFYLLLIASTYFWRAGVPLVTVYIYEKGRRGVLINSISWGKVILAIFLPTFADLILYEFETEWNISGVG